jgi:hypothetical protein
MAMKIANRSALGRASPAKCAVHFQHAPCRFRNRSGDGHSAGLRLDRRRRSPPPKHMLLGSEVQLLDVVADLERIGEAP